MVLIWPKVLELVAFVIVFPWCIGSTMIIPSLVTKVLPPLAHSVKELRRMVVLELCGNTLELISAFNDRWIRKLESQLASNISVLTA